MRRVTLPGLRRSLLPGCLCVAAIAAAGLLGAACSEGSSEDSASTSTAPSISTVSNSPPPSRGFAGQLGLENSGGAFTVHVPPCVEGELVEIRVYSADRSTMHWHAVAGRSQVGPDATEGFVIGDPPAGMTEVVRFDSDLPWRDGFVVEAITGSDLGLGLFRGAGQPESGGEIIWQGSRLADLAELEQAMEICAGG